MNLHSEFSCRNKYDSPCTLVLIGGKSNSLPSASFAVEDEDKEQTSLASKTFWIAGIA